MNVYSHISIDDFSQITKTTFTNTKVIDKENGKDYEESIEKKEKEHILEIDTGLRVANFDDSKFWEEFRKFGSVHSS